MSKDITKEPKDEHRTSHEHDRSYGTHDAPRRRRTTSPIPDNLEILGDGTLCRNSCRHKWFRKEMALPKVQEVIIPRSRRQRAQSTIDEPTLGLPGTGVSSGLQALLTPTLATHAGGTVLSKLGVSTAGGPRLIIPLPAVLASVATLQTGNITPSTIADAKQGGSSPSILIDTEWFYPQAYPLELQRYLATGYNFETKPTNPGRIMDETWAFLRAAYRCLKFVGLDVKISAGLKEIFDATMKKRPGSDRPLHPYAESDAIKNIYMILAYTLSTLLWSSGATKPLRDYKEPTYPGVIIACYVSRMTRYYNDISTAMKLNDPTSLKPYLPRGGRDAVSDEAQLKGVAPRESVTAAWANVPLLAVTLRTVAEYATGRQTDVTNCSGGLYTALQDAALNVKGMDDVIAKKNIELLMPGDDNPLAGQITDARCKYFLGLVRGTIKPSDTSKAVPDGEPGIEPLVIPDDDDDD